MTKTKKLVISGILVALSIVLTRLLSINPEPYIRISFGFVPIILSGIILGPVFGFAVGAVADLLGCILFGFPPYLPITLTSALVGLMAYLIYRLMRNSNEWAKVLVTVIIIQIVCSILLQTYWLSTLGVGPFITLLPWRAIVAVGSIPVYAILIFAILSGLRKANLVSKPKKSE